MPSAPEAPVVSDVYSDNLKLSWKAPQKEGGAPVIGYHIERCSSTAQRWVYVTKDTITDTNYHVKELFSDTIYEFRVIAENKYGLSKPSPPSKPVLAKDPWGTYDFSKYFYFTTYSN